MALTRFARDPEKTDRSHKSIDCPKNDRSQRFDRFPWARTGERDRSGFNALANWTNAIDPYEIPRYPKPMGDRSSFGPYLLGLMLLTLPIVPSSLTVQTS